MGDVIGHGVGEECAGTSTTSPRCLSDLPVGAAAVVRRVVAAPTGIGRRLRDLGFIPGTGVRVMRRAPLGDPLVLELRGFQLCLRSRDAALIHVDPDDGPRSA